MAVRTTAEKVEAIIEVESGVDLTPFIEDANELVTECCLDSDYSAARLIRIETWLAAHFYAIYSPRLANENAGGVGQSIETSIGLGFNVTRYGQQAMRLDTAGNLAALDRKTIEGKARRTLGATWLGTEEDE